MIAFEPLQVWCGNPVEFEEMFINFSTAWSSILTQTPSKLGLSPESKGHLIIWLRKLFDDINDALKDYDESASGQPLGVSLQI